MKINYSAKCILSLEDLKAAKLLFEHHHQVDQTFSDPYLSNRYNFNQSMPSFFMAYKGEKMVGLLAVYADEPEVEVSIIVDPDYRREGIATKLYHNFQSETEPYGIESVTFKSERVFLDKHPQLLNRWGLVESQEEILMGHGRNPYSIKERSDLKVERASGIHIESIASFQAESFADDYEVSLRYAKETVANPESPIYLALFEEKVVASISVDQSTDVNYLFSIAVNQRFRGQGIASYLMKKTINDLISHTNKLFHLAVEVDNLPAFNLYKKLDFHELTRIVYLDFLK